MPRKVFQLQVELDVQAVTCPGVWLCPNGNITLQLFMLDSCIQTSPTEPVFPLLYHEKFIFYKIFSKANRLSELQKSLNKERLYAELIQWHNCEIGNVLATFEMCLSDLLYPSSGEGAIAGVDIDLLMESTKCFPGIISPKIEVSTRTTVEETLCKSEHKKCTAFVINPKVIRSSNVPAKTTKLHQRKVCHSVGYHRLKRVHLPAKRPKKPPFVVRKVDEGLINRKPKVDDDGDVCTCRLRRSKSESSFLTSSNSKVSGEQERHPKRLSFSPFLARKCSCRKKQKEDSCAICDKYKNLSQNNCRCVQKNVESVPVRTKMYNSCLCQLPKMHPEQIHCGCNSGAFKKPLEMHADKNNFTDCCKGCYSNVDDSESCLCAPKQSSLATQLHERLTNTLKQSASCIPCDNLENCRSQNTFDSTYDSDRFSDSTCPRKSHHCKSKKDFYENIEKFYDRLFRKSCVCTS